MGRHIKEGLDYFPVELSLDDKWELVESKHGLEGFAILIKLLQRIYQYGYYTRWGERERLIFSNKINVDINRLMSFIDDCISFEIFDKTIFENYQILTSRGIQKRYFAAVIRRKQITICKKILLIDINVYINDPTKLIYVDINSYSPSINASRSTHSKVKESKVKKIVAKIDVDKNSDYLPLAHRLLELHLEIDPAFIGKKSSNGFLETSANAFRLLIERDGREIKEVETILEWCKRDEFWCSVIQSGGGFRRNYAQMKTQWLRKARKEEAEMEKAGFTLDEDIEI